MNDSSTPPERERVGPILGIALALFFLIGLVGALIWQRSRTVDARETLGAWFDTSALPFGLAPVESAELANGDLILRLVPEGGAPEPERRTPPPAKPDGDKGTPFDWTAIEVKPPGDGPCEVFVVRYPFEAAAPRLKQLFESFGPSSPEMIPSSGGRAVLDSGDLPWREWSAPYVLEREYEPGGTVRDTIRVNLTREKTAQVCFVRFPRGSSASPKKVEELLAALVPK
ncbi:MAG: hypothetical protein K8S98_14515 [Planctomycetes bacterium]|nr:hypothetical protein [Planctomycetota bacterium]